MLGYHDCFGGTVTSVSQYCDGCIGKDSDQSIATRDDSKGAADVGLQMVHCSSRNIEVKAVSN